jgi:hypothetical protein
MLSNCCAAILRPFGDLDVGVESTLDTQSRHRGCMQRVRAQFQHIQLAASALPGLGQCPAPNNAACSKLAVPRIRVPCLGLSLLPR